MAKERQADWSPQDRALAANIRAILYGTGPPKKNGFFFSPHPSQPYVLKFQTLV
jgi:hypothetical protein